MRIRNGVIDNSCRRELGIGLTTDLIGNRQSDSVIGYVIDASEIYWLEQSADPRERRIQHRIGSGFGNSLSSVFDNFGDDCEEEFTKNPRRRSDKLYSGPLDGLSQFSRPPKRRNDTMGKSNRRGIDTVDVDANEDSEVVSCDTVPGLDNGPGRGRTRRFGGMNRRRVPANRTRSCERRGRVNPMRRSADRLFASVYSYVNTHR